MYADNVTILTVVDVLNRVLIFFPGLLQSTWQVSAMQ